jgi:hypothetical protein
MARLNSKKQKKSSFYKEKYLVGLTPAPTNLSRNPSTESFSGQADLRK